MRLLLFTLLLLTGCTLSDQPVTSYILDEGSLDVSFCPKENCEELLIDFLRRAQDSIHCAFFDLNLENLHDFFVESDVDFKLVIDERYAHAAHGFESRIDKGAGYMHNKFCIVDDSHVFTGSMNPTVRGATKNNNNILFIESDVISSIYSKKFFDLWNGETTVRKKSPVLLDGNKVDIYFCPEDRCADKIVKKLREAQESIYFMTFSFTHTGISNVLLTKSDEGIDVKGIFEKTQLSTHSVFDILDYQKPDVRIDGNSFTMHHKVFIIDEKTVITGSMNPSKNGDEKSDENVLIIENEDLAQEFLDEFWSVYGEGIVSGNQKFKT